ncbi:MAG: ABC-type multidrug transport system, ATPase component [halophilic archaeon J07HX5]|nr:MAG: ABC-type multidrug transport system, ATPase component [halophilic archaeon J07HX5]
MVDSARTDRRGAETATSMSGTDSDTESGFDSGSESRSGAESALAIDGLSKRFESGDATVVAVDDVSLTVDRGAVVGLLGPNGAGKTSLIKCALGIVVPDAGTIRVLGTNVTDGRRAAYADVDAMLEGARNDYWRLTVRENLRYFATIHGVDPDSVAGRHTQLLERFDLAEKADTPVRALSRGMKQKVSLASALAGGAALVFLDEPTLGLDVESSRTLRHELRRLAREEGLTVVLSSHDMGVIEEICDRVVMMADGRIVADDTVSALLAEAGRNTVRVTSSDIDETVVAALRRQFTVQAAEIKATTHRSHVEVGAAGDALYELMDTLREAGVTVEEIETVQPSLEEVFVDLTGMGSTSSGDTGQRQERSP